MQLIIRHCIHQYIEYIYQYKIVLSYEFSSVQFSKSMFCTRPIKMIVHLLSGHNISVVIEETEKVSIVKKRIQQVLGKPYEKISLIHEGIILDDDHIISDYRITTPYG